MIISAVNVEHQQIGKVKGGEGIDEITIPRWETPMLWRMKKVIAQS